MNSEMDFGPQPLIQVMEKLGITNKDLANASTEQLSFKVISKGCKGRKLTPNAKYKILSALQGLCPDENLTLKQIFNY